MNRDTLTLLGCSSLAVMLLTTHNAANANTIAPQNVERQNVNRPVEIEFKAPNADQVDVKASSQEDPQPESLEVMSDTVGNQAVEQYGCDCKGCRNQVLSMVQSSKQIRVR